MVQVVQNSTQDTSKGRLGFITLKSKDSDFSDYRAGQFYMLSLLGGGSSDPLLPRPFAPYDITRDKISFLYAVVGRGTELLSRQQKGARLRLSKPLGTGFSEDLPKGSKVALVAGGVGLAPLRYLARKIYKKAEVAFYYGANTYVDIFQPFVREKASIYKAVSTIDGSYGFKGFVTEPFEREASRFNRVFICGPESMARAALEICGRHRLIAEVSKEQVMACGIGVCGGCLVDVKGETKRCCADGPVFTVLP